MCYKIDQVSFSFGETKFQLDANREGGAKCLKYTLEYTLILKGATEPLKETHRALQIITHEDLFSFLFITEFLHIKWNSSHASVKFQNKTAVVLSSAEVVDPFVGIASLLLVNITRRL